jgi:hypothetical protein
MDAKTYFHEWCVLRMSHPSWTPGGGSVTVLFTVRITLKQNAPTKHRCSGIRIYQLYCMSGCTYNNMDIYFGKGRTCVTTDMIAAHANAKQHKRWKDMEISYTMKTSFHHLIKRKEEEEKQICPYTPWWCMGEWMYRSTFSWPWH